MIISTDKPVLQEKHRLHLWVCRASKGAVLTSLTAASVFEPRKKNYEGSNKLFLFQILQPTHVIAKKKKKKAAAEEKKTDPRC